MTTLLDETASHTDSSAGQRLRSLTAAVRLSFTWFGTGKTLTPEQKAQGGPHLRGRGRIPVGRQEADRHQTSRLQSRD
jgi:hypothetical protein